MSVVVFPAAGASQPEKSNFNLRKFGTPASLLPFFKSFFGIGACHSWKIRPSKKMPSCFEGQKSSFWNKKHLNWDPLNPSQKIQISWISHLLIFACHRNRLFEPLSDNLALSYFSHKVQLNEYASLGDRGCQRDETRSCCKKSTPSTLG